MPKEISRKTLAQIFQARMEEILEFVSAEIKSAGYEKKLIGGIVVTGGGALTRHITQLVEYKTGMDARVGMPNEHLSKGMVEEVKSPMYATGIGLVIHGLNKAEAMQQNAGEEEAADTTKKPVTVLERIKGWVESNMRNNILNE